jgi:hypothetical protein
MGPDSWAYLPSQAPVRRNTFDMSQIPFHTLSRAGFANGLSSAHERSTWGQMDIIDRVEARRGDRRASMEKRL